jgi:hypothetical protein
MKILYALIAFLVTSPLFGQERTFFTQSISFTRPGDTSAYASGDLVASSTTAGSVVPMSFTLGRTATGEQIRIDRIKFSKSTVTTTNAAFRVHLWLASPTVANGDNAAFSASQVSTYLGQFDVTIGQAFTDGAAGFVITGLNSIVLTTQYVYALIEARGAYAPGNAEIFTLTIEGEQER